MEIFHECLTFVRSEEDVEDEELDGGIKRQWLSQFEFVKLFSTLPEPRFLGWMALWYRLPIMENGMKEEEEREREGGRGRGKGQGWEGGRRRERERGGGMNVICELDRGKELNVRICFLTFCSYSLCQMLCVHPQTHSIISVS